MINVKNKALVNALGESVKEFRLKKKLSQLDLSIEADVQLSQIGRIERGEINPTVSSLFVIAEALDCDLKTLFDFKLKSK